MVEKTMFFLKPEARRYADEIAAELAASGLYVESKGNHTFSAWNLKQLYPNLSARLKDATERHLLHAIVPVFLVSGENAVNRLADLAGRNVNPKKCLPQTIRRRYGSRRPLALGPGIFYYRNAIHRPQNAAEAARDIGVFFA